MVPADRGIASASIFGFKKWKKSSWGRRQWDTFKLKIPAKIGDVIHKIALARWSRTFSGLVHAGVPILQAIDITGDDRRQRPHRDARWTT